MVLRRLIAWPPVLALIAVCCSVLLPSSAQAVGDRDCGDFASQRDAQIFFLKAGGPRSDPHRLDDDGDGVACESNPGPYYYGKSLPKPPQKIRSTITLSTSRTAAIAGERVVLRTAVTPRTKRSVLLQWWAGGRWQRLTQQATTLNGTMRYRTKAPANSARYRAIVLRKTVGNRIYLSARSAERKLAIQKQSVTLALSRYQVNEGAKVTLTATTRPVRSGRPVTLEEYVAGAWTVRSTKTVSATGVATWSVTGGKAGERRFRLRMDPFHGAAAVVSTVRTLTIVDVTPPAAPAGLVATPGDGAVELSWAAVMDADRYRVFYRTSTSTEWLQAPITPTSPTAEVSGLTNETAYQFSVRAVDAAGNSSAHSAVATATPNAPTPDGE